jgi:hypothetical protein
VEHHTRIERQLQSTNYVRPENMTLTPHADSSSCFHHLLLGRVESSILDSAHFPLSVQVGLLVIVSEVPAPTAFSSLPAAALK